MHGNVSDRNGRSTYLNGVLTVIAVLLGIIALQIGPDPASVAFGEARSGRQPTPAPPNAAGQRIQMIQIMERISAQLDSIEQTSTKVMDVNVVNTPEVTISE
jgi:hypothetical protein